MGLYWIIYLLYQTCHCQKYRCYHSFWQSNETRGRLCKVISLNRKTVVLHVADENTNSGSEAFLCMNICSSRCSVRAIICRFARMYGYTQCLTGHWSLWLLVSGLGLAQAIITTTQTSPLGCSIFVKVQHAVKLELRGWWLVMRMSSPRISYLLCNHLVD